jgi:hypothetical protein
MSQKRLIICVCGVLLSALWCYFAAPTLQSRGHVFERQWYNPGVLLGWAAIWLICTVALFRTRER